MNQRNKVFTSLIVALFALLALSSISFANATGHGGRGSGRGDSKGANHSGHRGNLGHSKVIDRDAVHTVIAEALGLTVEEIAVAKDAGKSIATLAEEQGVAVEDIQAAITTEVTAQVEQAVADETITQEKADAILEKFANIDFTKVHGNRGNHSNRGHSKVIDRDAVRAVTAEVLGLTIDELDDAKDAGTNLATLAEEQGVEFADVEATIKAEMTAQVNQAVADGTITQEKADILLTRIADKDFSTAYSGNHGHGHRGHHDKTDDDGNTENGTEAEETAEDTSDTDKVDADPEPESQTGTVTISSVT